MKIPLTRSLKLSIFSLLLIFVFSNKATCVEKGNIPSNTLIASKLNARNITAASIPHLFDKHGIKYNRLVCLNWPDKYPYLPQIDFAIAHNDNCILIHYRVTEDLTIGTKTDDLSDVFNESCCELFCRPEGDSLYYNIEANCIGSILMQCGSGRSNRSISTIENLRKIDRWASLGKNSVGKLTHKSHWELSLVIPLSAFWKHSINSLSGKTFLANVYNCLGSGERKQFISWQPINTPKPDFHRPEFFKKIYFSTH